MDGFVHLHVHSHYSLLDGAADIKRLVQRAADQGMDALALTDHGNMFGAVEFYRAATDAGIKPILGTEAYISPTDRHDRSMGNITQASYHLVLLAMNETGWRNLMKLASRAYLEGFYYRPRIDRELLAELSDGLIATTACLGGEVPSAMLAGDYEKARRIAAEYRDIFGPERFFIELQKQGIEDQDKVNPHLVRLAGELGVGLVGTNDVHFLRRADKKAHEVLTCISTGKTLADGGAMEYPEEIYLKDAREMREALGAWPEAADNTLRIADMCDLKLDFSRAHLPHFDTPGGVTPERHLRDLAGQGLAARFEGRDVPPEYTDRLDWELKVIEDKGYSSYFLIVNDFVQYARRNNIPAAPRGSGVATLLGYALDIANVDPIRYGLLFERFTDPQREEAPDMDIDICQEGRGKVIQYVREKYGHVAQIITYGTLKARAAIRDVGRVMGVPLPDVDAIAKLVPEGPKVKIKDALEAEPDLQKMYDENPTVRDLIEHAKTLEGLARHAGVHAAGVIIADQPLEEIIPLCRQSDSADAITQWDGPTCDDVGLMKMDFLGLRTLTIIERARQLVRAATGKDVDPEKLALDDSKVFELFCEGRTDGVFQFESDGMKAVLMQMQPAKIGDLIAANAMYRPGPMELIGTYCARKSGGEEVPSVHPLVDDILAETYGIMCYQEQVMQVLNRLGKLPLNRSLTLIKAISKKKEKVIAEERPNFLEGAKENGIAEGEAAGLFDLILRFAGYGFNKAHSTRYAIVAYQAAYFKVHHPREFLAATLTFECGDTDKLVQYRAEAKRMGIDIAPPDINTCNSDFTVDGDRVRFGLAAVKGVGAKAVESIIAARDEHGAFAELYDFCANVDLRAVNRSCIEALIKCGAFDALGAHRAAMSAALDHAIELGQTAAEDRRTGQMNLFAGGDDDQPEPARFPDVAPWTEAQMLAAEKETLGFFVSSHPLVKYGREMESLSAPRGMQLGRIDSCGDRTPITIGCRIAQVRPTVTKTKGEKMAMMTVEDLTGKCDAVAFPRTYEQFAELIVPEEMVFLVGNVDWRRERPSIIVDEIIPIDDALARLTGGLALNLPPAKVADGLTGKLRELLEAHHGACPVQLRIRPRSRADVEVVLQAGEKYAVSPSRELIDVLVELIGEENIELKARATQPNGNGRNGNGRGRYRRNGGNGSSARAATGPASAAVTRFN